MTLTLPRPLFEGMVSTALAERPREACGLLAGAAGRVEAVVPLPNVSGDPLRFRAEPVARRAAIDAIAAAGRVWIGDWHSHVDDVAAPSTADLAAAAHGPAGFVHLILSLHAPTPRLAAYRFFGGRDIPVEVTIS